MKAFFAKFLQKIKKNKPIVAKSLVLFVLIIFTLICISSLTKAANATEYHIPTYYSIVLFILPALCVTAIFMPEIKNRKLKMAYQLILFAAVPLGSLFFAEALNLGNMFSLEIKALILNYLFILLVYFIFYAISNRFSIALIGATLLINIFSVANYYVLNFRDSNILPTDLLGITTAFNVMDSYEFFFSPILLLTLWFCVTVIFLALRNRIIVKNFIIRIVNLVLAVALCFGFWKIISTPKIYNSFDIEKSLYEPTRVSRKNGYYMNFMIFVPDILHAPPKGYHVNTLKTLVPAGDAANIDYEKPTVIVIMNESLVDMQKYSEIELSDDPLEFIHSLENDPSAFVGEVMVSTIGGGTSCSEFEFLTSFPLSLCDSSASPLAQFVVKPTFNLASSLNQLGYTSNFLHPVNHNNWGRSEAYPYLNFDNISFDTEMENPEFVRSYVSDKSCYNYMLNYFDENAYENQFYFIITMQNHGGYSSEEIESTVFVEPEHEIYLDLEQYLTAIQESDLAFEQLVAQLEQREEKIIIAMFGDHWPVFSAETTYETLADIYPDDAPDRMSKYTTPFILWSNYGEDFSSVPETMGLSYLAPVLKSTIGLPLTGFDKFVLETFEEYPILSRYGIYDKEGTFLAPQGSATTYPGLDSYTKLIYNALFDRKNPCTAIFEYSNVN